METLDRNLSRGMRQLNGRYTQQFHHFSLSINRFPLRSLVHRTERGGNGLCFSQVRPFLDRSLLSILAGFIAPKICAAPMVHLTADPGSQRPPTGFQMRLGSLLWTVDAWAAPLQHKNHR